MEGRSIESRNNFCLSVAWEFAALRRVTRNNLNDHELREI